MRALLLVIPVMAFAVEPVPLVSEVELQPLVAQARRVIEATDYLGEPFASAETESITTAFAEADAKTAVTRVQKLLDARVLFVVTINPEMRVKVAPGPAKPALVENGWRQFL